METFLTIFLIVITVIGFIILLKDFIFFVVYCLYKFCSGIYSVAFGVGKHDGC